MANKYLLILLFIVSANARMIYRRYQKEHKNYVQVIEIFETKSKPPLYIENEKELNDFLGKDSFKSDMNCTDENSNGKTTEKVKSTTKRTILSTSSVRPPFSTTSFPSTTTRMKNFIPTTVYMDHMVTYSPPPFPKLPSHPTRDKSTTTRQPNQDNLFTVSSSKPTIKANPKENENPDYTELFNWSTTTKSSNTPILFTTTHVPNTDIQEKNILNGIDDKNKLNGHSGEYSENEYDNNSQEYDELPPEDFGESDEDIDNVDDDVTKRRKRYQSLRKRQAFN